MNPELNALVDYRSFPHGGGIFVFVRILLFTTIATGLVIADTGKSVKLMSETKETVYRSMIPKLPIEMIKERTLFYTESEMPKAHQDWESLIQGITDSRENVSGNRSEPFGNGNREFPWASPAGVHLSGDSVSTVRFLTLPEINGKQAPVVYYRSPALKYILPDGTRMDSALANPGLSWSFPKGTIIGEMLMLTDSRGYTHPFEVRVRIRQLNKWTMNVYKPFPTAADLLEALKSSKWKDNHSVQRLIDHLKSPLVTDVYTLADQHPDRVVFKQKRYQDVLPALDEGVVTDLLDNTAFVSALGVVWRGTGDFAPHAPTTSADFHIVPKKYNAGFIEISSKSCMQCHESANKSVDDFDSRRDWYGRVRGSDGIFSFHPFEPSSYLGGRGKPISFNKSLLEGGIIAEFDEKVHSSTIYSRLRD